MPFRPKTTKRVIVRRRMTRRKKLPNVKQISFFTPRNINAGLRYAVKGVNLMKGIINSEIKKSDISMNPLQPSTTAIFTLLSEINQGDDYNNRQGNSVLDKYLTLRWGLSLNAAATFTQVRMIIFIDGDNDMETPTEAQLLTTPTNLMSSINPDYSARFTILYDQVHNLSNSGEKVISDKFYKVLNFHSKFVTGTGATGFGRNSIWLYLKSTEATNTPVFTGYSRIAFYDN